MTESMLKNRKLTENN